MQWIREHGGPSPAYQSEVEHGAKAEVGSQVLGVWVRLLKVTEAYARGEIPSYMGDPIGCRGLAAHARHRIQESGKMESLQLMDPVIRTREVLKTIVEPPTPIPMVVLAYCLGLRVEVIQGMVDGTFPIMPSTIRVIADLTTLPISFFVTGSFDEMSASDLVIRYGRALMLANEFDVSPEELVEMLQKRRP